MKEVFLILAFASIAFGCINDQSESINDNVVRDDTNIEEQTFSREKWVLKEGNTYPYRQELYKSILYSDSIRTLNKDELINAIGETDRINENHYYYLITRNKIGSMPLNQKTLVIKLSDRNEVEWIKLHE